MAQTRTAVVMVHGIGNQRPLATVRAIVRALYFRAPREDADERPQVWLKLDRSGDDLDLPVITTADLAMADGTTRQIDFHECYWAPLMAELRFLAVPLWLFELIRKGRDALTPKLRPLWYGVGVLIALWCIAASLLGLEGFIALLGIPAKLWFGGAIAVMAAATVTALLFRQLVVAVLLAGLTLLLGWPWTTPLPPWFLASYTVALPWITGAILTFTLMGQRGLMLFGGLLSILVAGWLAMGWFNSGFGPLPLSALDLGPLPMSLGQPDSRFWAAMALLLFVAMNWFFLLTVAGDAARYLRGSPGNIMVRRQIRALGVDLLRHLHAAQWQGQPKYDRIIIVSHSLGTIVAYDMLRAYWSEVASLLGDPYAIAGAEQQDRTPGPTPDQPWTDADRMGWRSRAWAILRALDTAMVAEPDCFAGDRARRWIVSDFVTLGSPLTHGEYLMAEGPDGEALRASFEMKRRQREFPTAPAHPSGEGMLAFERAGQRRFHHGALFALTRWTNIYFPVRKIFWGDLVGGPLQPLFGQAIADVPVSGAPDNDLFAHTRYWDSARDKPPTPALSALRDAVNLRALAG